MFNLADHFIYNTLYHTVIWKKTNKQKQKQKNATSVASGILGVFQPSKIKVMNFAHHCVLRRIFVPVTRVSRISKGFLTSLSFVFQKQYYNTANVPVSFPKNKYIQIKTRTEPKKKKIIKTTTITTKQTKTNTHLYKQRKQTNTKPTQKTQKKKQTNKQKKKQKQNKNKKQKQNNNNNNNNITKSKPNKKEHQLSKQLSSAKALLK